MKFIHCADLHIDSRMKTHLNVQQANDRRREILLTFERMVNYAIENDVSAILIAGDMFDTSAISSSTKKRIRDIIQENSNLDFLYLAGNHDESNLIEEFVGLENLKTFDKKWTSYDYGDVRITGCKTTKNTNYDLLSLDREKVNIVMLHGQIVQHNVEQNNENIPLPMLKNKNIDYLALGHIHSYESQQLDNRGVYAYSGCLEGRGFDECGKKGFILIEVKGDNIRHEFVPFASRELFDITYDLSNGQDWFDVERGIIDAVSESPTSSMVKVTLVGKYPLSLEKQIDFTEKKLNSTFYFAKIKDNSSLKLDEKDYSLDMSLRGEFIRKVMASDMSQEDQDAIILMGVRALEGEDIV